MHSAVKKYQFRGVTLLLACLPSLVHAQYTWTAIANFGGGVREAAVSFSVGNKGYVGLGRYASSPFCKDLWEYDPCANTWTQKANFGGTARWGATAFSIGNKAYVGTGYDGSGNQADFWEYDPSTNSWSQKTNFGGTGRESACGFGIGSKGYIGTGVVGSGPGFKDFWEFDPSLNTWTQKANYGGGLRWDITSFTIGGKGYFFAGYDGGLNYSDLWEYDPGLNIWTAKASLPAIGRRSAAGFAINGKGYLGTGLTGSTYLNDFWQWDPGSNTWTAMPSFPGTTRFWGIGFSIDSITGYIGIGDINYPSVDVADFWSFNCCPSVSLPNSADSICRGNSVLLTVSGGTSYSWTPSTGLSCTTCPNPLATPLATTTYTVIDSLGWCKATSLVTIQVVTSSIASFSYAYDPCRSHCLALTNTSSNVFTSNWDFGDGHTSTAYAPCHTYSDSASYTVTLIVNDSSVCRSTYTQQVAYPVWDTTTHVFIPTAFSPNGDGHNDRLCFYRKDNVCLEMFQIFIYDRWGDKVFEAHTISDSWDGTYKGLLLNSAEFVYYCKIRTVGGQQQERKGSVSLIR